MRIAVALALGATLSACAQRGTDNKNTGGGDRRANGSMVGYWLSQGDVSAFRDVLDGKSEGVCEQLVQKGVGTVYLRYGLATQILANGDMVSCDLDPTTRTRIKCEVANPLGTVDLHTGNMRSGTCGGRLILVGDRITYSGECNGRSESGTLVAISEAGYLRYTKMAYTCLDKANR